MHTITKEECLNCQIIETLAGVYGDESKELRVSVNLNNKEVTFIVFHNKIVVDLSYSLEEAVKFYNKIPV